MDSIPYELLQMIASYLLPRGQCRLALASKYYYEHLYNDLLKWHARKDAIAVPYHHITNTIAYNDIDPITTLCINKIVIYAELYHYNELIISNLTTGDYGILREKYLGRRNYVMNLRYVYADAKAYVNTIPKTQYKYLHKNNHIAFLNIKTPLCKLDYFIKKRIMDYLDTDAFNEIKSCKHLSAIMVS